MPETYNIYCDESSIENQDNQFMLIGALFMERNKRNEIRDRIKNLRKKYNYYGEIKWNKTSTKLLKFYQEIIDLFFSYSANEFQFHCIKVDRLKVKYNIYHNNDKEEGFYKFYYQLLKNKFSKDCQYYIFLDYKPTGLKNRVKTLEHYLKYRIANYSKSKIKKIQEYPSQNNVFIQIADLFVGAVNHDNNISDSKSKAKQNFIQYLSAKAGKENLRFCSLPSEAKFNIFCINLEK